MKKRTRPQGERGAATIEAILAISVFVIVWTGVLLMGRSYSAKLEVKSRARTCAWLQSVNSCDVEIDCASSFGDGNISDASDIIGDQASSAGEGTWFEELLDDTLDAAVERLFGERTTVELATEVERPILLGGETVAVSASYSLPCNTKPVSTESLVDQLAEIVKRELL